LEEKKENREIKQPTQQQIKISAIDYGVRRTQHNTRNTNKKWE
jgi:hypothetical protein